MNRRSFLETAGTIAGGSLLATVADGATRSTSTSRSPIVSPGGGRAVVTPNGATLPLRRVGGVLVGHLVAEPVDHEITPGLRIESWGYNGRTHGPTIEAVEGERLRIYVTNRLPEPTTVHWHGLVVPNGMDGVAGLSQPPIPVGETFVYEFPLRRAGTYMYHPHYDEMTQIALGMAGILVVHPRRPSGPRVDRDFALLSHEWRIPVGARRPDPGAMNDWNVLTFNGRSFPGTEPLLVERGERVRIRLGNLGPMDHHPIHLHGLSFEVTGTDGGAVPPSARWPETTVLLPVGSTRDIEFVADEPGDWAVHCHMTHHVMTQMGHGLPNLIGADPSKFGSRAAELVRGYMPMGATGMGEMAEMPMAVPENSRPMRGGEGPFGAIDMGGMFTILKVRESLAAPGASDWYVNPEGAVAGPADPAHAAADGLPL